MGIFKRKFRKFRDLNKEEKYRYLKMFFIISIAFNIMFFGGCLNLAAVHYNANSMPVLTAEGHSYEDGIHSSYSDISEVNLFYLTDIIKLGDNIYSIGDFIIFLGAVFSNIFLLNLIILDYKIRKIKDEEKKDL